MFKKYRLINNIYKIPNCQFSISTKFFFKLHFLAMQNYELFISKLAKIFHSFFICLNLNINIQKELWISNASIKSYNILDNDRKVAFSLDII